MSFDRVNRESSESGDASTGVAAGKRSRTAALPIQRKSATEPVGRGAASGAADSRADDPFGLHLDGQVSTATAARSLEATRDSHLGADGSVGDRLFRVPTGSEITSMLKAGTIPEDKLIASIETALTRMAKEGKLKVPDAVSEIIKRIFPKPGVFDEAEFAKVVDTGDRSRIYQSVADAQTKLNTTDQPKVEGVMDDAVKLIDAAIGNDAGLTEVFGTKAATAKAVYQKAKLELQTRKGTIDVSLNTDYNRDDEEIGLGGWANFGKKQVHLQRKVAEVLVERVLGVLPFEPDLADVLSQRLPRQEFHVLDPVQ